MGIAWALVVWYGALQTQTSYSISGIASQQECERLAAAIKRDGWSEKTRCYPYKKAP
ncbi:hypothetical protein [Bacillus thuringiensis]|uniref:hypothetical protein n=1 Tax=Bacillus thuringiensis TaxID=1428 RepID=UPI002175FA14|nr:hypothetical protein [Bacillus thuringiensis]